MPPGEGASGRGLTTREVAQRYRVNPDKVRGWVRAGLLKAVNTSGAKCRNPRLVFLPDALADFERARSAAATPPPKMPRRRRTGGQTDFFPD